MARSHGLRVVGLGLALVLAAGCSIVPNYYKETGPSVTMPWETPTSVDVRERFEPAAQRDREWPETHLAAESGVVEHLPLYFEDPFEDKGHGRTDATDPHNVYRLGWEDWVAMPYGLARFTANWLLLPVSAVVTPPWTVMESDGFLSRQLLGYDHDAIPAGRESHAVPVNEPPPPPAIETVPPEPPAQEPPPPPAAPS